MSEYNKLIIDEFQSLLECRASILLTAQNISNDISSTWINQNRIDSMRSLLDLFESYNNLIIEIESKVKN